MKGYTNMLDIFLNKKKYYLGICIIMLLYIIITILIWKKLPSEIYIPFRWNGYRIIGFYGKSIQNVKYVFLTPLVGITIIQVAREITFTNQDDLFYTTIAKTLDVICYLFIILEPLAFIVCSFYHNSFLSYYFYLISFIIITISIFTIRYRWKRELEK